MTDEFLFRSLHTKTFFSGSYSRNPVHLLDLFYLREKELNPSDILFLSFYLP